MSGQSSLVTLQTPSRSNKMYSCTSCHKGCHLITSVWAKWCVGVPLQSVYISLHWGVILPRTTRQRIIKLIWPNFANNYSFCKMITFTDVCGWLWLAVYKFARIPSLVAGQLSTWFALIQRHHLQLWCASCPMQAKAWMDAWPCLASQASYAPNLLGRSVWSPSGQAIQAPQESLTSCKEPTPIQCKWLTAGFVPSLP